MRPELYADSRDVWKWSVVLDHALRENLSVYWVAMVRPDANEHGQRENWENLPPHTRPEVAEFFQQERRLIARGERPNLWRVGRLCDQLNVRFESNMSPYACVLNRRARYVESLFSFLDGRPSRRRDLVLLDPDNGFGIGKSNGYQMHLDHLAHLWKGMRVGDSLAMVQFNHFVKNWVEALRRSLAGVLKIETAALQSHAWQNVCIYLADKSG